MANSLSHKPPSPHKSPQRKRLKRLKSTNYPQLSTSTDQPSTNQPSTTNPPNATLNPPVLRTWFDLYKPQITQSQIKSFFKDHYGVYLDTEEAKHWYLCFQKGSRGDYQTMQNTWRKMGRAIVKGSGVFGEMKGVRKIRW